MDGLLNDSGNSSTPKSRGAETENRPRSLSLTGGSMANPTRENTGIAGDAGHDSEFAGPVS